jgi:hypothetical protein
MEERILVDENKTKKRTYNRLTAESDTNPSALKFVVSRMLTKNAIEFKKHRSKQ